MGNFLGLLIHLVLEVWFRPPRNKAENMAEQQQASTPVDSVEAMLTFEEIGRRREAISTQGVARGHIYGEVTVTDNSTMILGHAGQQEASNLVDSFEALLTFEELRRRQEAISAQGVARGHRYGEVTATDNFTVIRGNAYGATTISGNARVLLGDLHTFRQFSRGSKLDRRILSVQNELVAQHRVIQNTLLFLVDEAGLDRAKVAEDDSLEVFIGRPQNVIKIIMFLREAFWPFMRLIQSIDACLQAIGSYIMEATDNSYIPPGSWSSLIDGIKSHATTRAMGVTTSFNNQPESWKDSTESDQQIGQTDTVRRILSNLRAANQRFGMLVLKAERFTGSDGSSVTDETASTSSRDTEESEPTASFLSVFVRDKERSSREEFVEALLDTGATADCLSLDLSEKLGLEPVPGRKFIRTAAHDQELISPGTVKVIIKWQDRSKIFRQETKGKRQLYVVPGLILPLILSHDFTTKYADTGIWEVCAKGESIFEHVAPFGFGKIKARDREAEMEAQRARKEANRRAEQEEIEARNTQLEALLNTSTTTDGQSPSNVSRDSTDPHSGNTQQS